MNNNGILTLIFMCGSKWGEEHNKITWTHQNQQPILTQDCLKEYSPFIHSDYYYYYKFWKNIIYVM